MPPAIREVWSQWRDELQLLSTRHISRCYFPKDVSMQLHGFSDASQLAYAGVVYLRMENGNGDIYTSLIVSKMKGGSYKEADHPSVGVVWSPSPCSAFASLQDGFSLVPRPDLRLDGQYHCNQLAHRQPSPI